MSEYKPITGELRDWFEHAYSYDVGETPWFGWKSTIEQMLDAIDSIHAALEAENERLREQADKQTIGDLFVRVHLDYSDMAKQLELAAQAVRNIGGDAE